MTTFIDLPDDVIQQIILATSIGRDRANLAITCKHVHSLSLELLAAQRAVSRINQKLNHNQQLSQTVSTGENCLRRVRNCLPNPDGIHICLIGASSIFLITGVVGLSLTTSTVSLVVSGVDTALSASGLAAGVAVKFGLYRRMVHYFHNKVQQQRSELTESLADAEAAYQQAEAHYRGKTADITVEVIPQQANEFTPLLKR